MESRDKLNNQKRYCVNKSTQSYPSCHGDTLDTNNILATLYSLGLFSTILSVLFKSKRGARRQMSA